MKSIAKVLIYISLVTLIYNIQGYSVEKKYNKTKKMDPLAEKAKRHQVKLNAPNRIYFTKEIKQIAKKIQTTKESIKSEKHTPLSTQQIKSLEVVSDNTLQIRWNKKANVPLFIDGKKLGSDKWYKAGQPEKAAHDFFVNNKELLKIEVPVQEFQLIQSSQDKYGLIHLRYQQKYNGLEVWGRDVALHFNKQGELSAFNGRYIPSPVHLKSATETITKGEAIAKAENIFSGSPREINAHKLIFVDEGERASLAWLVRVKGNLAENWHYFIDAQTGAILKKYNHVMTDGPVTGSAVDLLNATRTINAYQIGNDFALIDASKPMFNASGSNLPQDGKGVIYTLDAQNGESTLFLVTSNNVNSWADRAAVSASANGALVYDFFSDIFGRNAIDGIGSTMNIIVNFKQGFNNAFWNGQQMVFGNGDGQNFSPLAAALDVTAHEMSHGVVERTANLVYENQPGALNESFADVFGVLFEFWVEGENGDWLLGEDITTPTIAGDALRNVENPGAANVAFNGQQPARMSEFQNLPNTEQGDNGGVHINSGIPNRAFFLIATDPSVGRDKAGAIYYHALSNYLNRNSQFIDCRLALIRSAEDIHGAGSTEASVIAQAFDAVEIFNGEVTPPPAPIPPVAGDEYLVAISTDDGLLYRLSTTSDEVITVTDTPLYSRPSVTDDGELVFYVDQNNNLHLVGSDGSGDQQLSESGGFSNVAISPSGQFLAATSTFEEPVIYIFDLDGSGEAVTYELFNPTTAQGESDANVLFPDRIDWASDSDILMYDALNIEVTAFGDTIGYWDINLLQASTGGIGRLFPAQPEGVSIGNPVFASNTDNIIALDYFDENGEVTVLGINLITNDVQEITFNFESPGSPTFSNDDSKVYYHYIDEENASLWVVDLLSDGITGAGNDEGLISGAVFPVAFGVGERPFPTEVENIESSMPEKFALVQNYPNPFNPETTIQYELPIDSEVLLTVYDIKGKLVTTLENSAQKAGEHTVVWTGRNTKGQLAASGVYFYRLKFKNALGNVSTLTRKMTLLK